MSGWRLPPSGIFGAERIDRERRILFRFDGRNHVGLAGDSLASALLANGISMVGRSFKYRRPRGIFAAGPEEPNAILQVGRGAAEEPNARATVIPLREGLLAAPVNCRPGLRVDMLAALQPLARFMPAGFYYKTFKAPGWESWEPAIRRAAGLGTLDPAPAPAGAAHRYAHCDVLVVGAGPAGLAAAEAAGAAGARVILAEQDEAAGGNLAWDDRFVDGQPSALWAERLAGRLAGRGNVTLLTRTTAFGLYDHGYVSLAERLPTDLDRGAPPATRLWGLRARRIVLACGALERPLVFQNNDLPGVMLASAVRRYLAQYKVAAGRTAVVFTATDDGYRTAFALRMAGVEVAAIVDPRPDEGPAAQRARDSGLPVFAGSVVSAARGRRAVRAVRIDALQGGRHAELACDLLAVSGGWTPSVHLFSQAGGSLDWDPAQGCFRPAGGPAGIDCAGAGNGQFGLAGAIAAGRLAGTAAAEAAGATAPSPPRRAPDPPEVLEDAEAPPAQLWLVPGANPRKSWVDLQSDVTAADIALAAGENYRSVEHLKRYTTLGMATDQGKTSNVNGLALLAAATGQAIPEVGTTRFRPPFTPVPLAAFAGPYRGDLYRPRRFLPAHAAHVAEGAAFEDFGGWQRPEAYPRGPEDVLAAAAREALAARRGAGLFDASPLGKIEVYGPDAATFLDRIYANTMSTLKPGRVRYGLMLSEHGGIFDDGVCARLAPDRFLVSATSGHAAAVAAMMDEWLQCEWVGLKVLVSDLTTAWATIAVTGPRARSILAALDSGIELAPEAFPHMSVREGRLGGVAARVMRVSFTGDLSYEVSVPAGHGESLWLAARAAGHTVPIGVEALMILRTEKGFIHVGADTDATTQPADIGMAAAIARKPGDFVGRRSLSRPAFAAPGRLQLVGLERLDGTAPFPVGSHIVEGRGSARASAGAVTSSCFSPILDRPVALAMLRDGLARTGEEVRVFDRGAEMPARVVARCFLDPANARLHG